MTTYSCTIESTTAEIGTGVFFDHATGLVIGETAKVGHNCTILHGVTLGGTGKQAGDRHPKIGNDVLIGAGSSILGNIKIGNGAKIGAGSIVLKPIPHGATAVGAPAKVIGWARESRPGSEVDMSLNNIVTVGDPSTTSTSANSLTDSSSNESLHNGSDDMTGKRTGLVATMKERKDLHEKSKDRKKLFSTASPKSFCIFSMLSQCKKEGQLCYEDFSEVLKDKCSEDEIGEVFMGLLKKNPSTSNVSKEQIVMHFKNIAQKYTHLCEEECEKVISLLLAERTS